MSLSLPAEVIENRIYVFRGQKVMLDRDLAKLYEVEIRSLNQSVRRNIKRFPQDFCFQLTKEEWASLKSQFVILKPGRGGKGFRPLAFTEPGIAMLSSVLKSDRAIAINIQIIRTFISLRDMALEHSDLRLRIDFLEKNTTNNSKSCLMHYDKRLMTIRRRARLDSKKRNRYTFSICDLELMYRQREDCGRQGQRGRNLDAR